MIVIILPSFRASSIAFFEASLNECEKNKIDLEKINHITFNQEYKNQTHEKVFFIYSFED